MTGYWDPTLLGCKAEEKGNVPDDGSKKAMKAAEQPNTLRKKKTNQEKHGKLFQGRVCVRVSHRISLYC